MAQGALRLSKKSKTRVTKKQQNAKSAAPKIIKPKNISKKERQAYKLAKQHQAKLHSNTEKLVSSRVGHLEILKGNQIQEGAHDLSVVGTTKVVSSWSNTGVVVNVIPKLKFFKEGYEDDQIESGSKKPRR
ncbi:unnamed protein product [Ambrosiozyma monospora]|uniref:Unnamed protein product n=1 Tax=Ambrosiozyma monospora TaxID=43982 RepID=A0ACB5SRS7_AMBMO|nr:unnamed protein product [Ambrosiozyma monospora]